MMSAAFSAIMMTGALVLPEVMAGIMEASTTRRPCNPFTLHSEHKNTHRYNVRTDNPFTLHGEHKNRHRYNVRTDNPFTLHGEHKNTHLYNVSTDNLIFDNNNNSVSSE